MSDQEPKSQLGVPYEQGTPSPAFQAAQQAALQAPPGTLAGAQATQHLQSMAGPPAGSQASIPVDPLSRPYKLPSGGLLYPDHDGTVLISPMRGEQEAMLAGIGEGAAASAAIRHVVQQCVDTRGMEFEDLEVTDWSAILLHLLAQSAGTDEIPLRPLCKKPRGCGNVFQADRLIDDIRCRILRRAGPGEESTWPPAWEDEDRDEDEALIREIVGDEEADGKAVDAKVVYLVDGNLPDPETVLEDGTRIVWRYLRVRDQIQAEEFAERKADHRTTPQSILFKFLNACMIQTINGRRTGVLGAMQWVKRQPSFVLDELRSDISRQSFGYELEPRFRCTHCGHSFKKELPLDGRLFRRRNRSKHRRS